MTEKTVFPKTIDEELPGEKVTETENIFALMALEAIRPGHVLVIPKEPVPQFFDLDETVMNELMKVATRIAKAIEIKFKPKRVGLIVAGFDVPHAHLHVVPMHDYHEITTKEMLEGTLQKSSGEELELNAEQIRKVLSATG